MNARYPKATRATLVVSKWSLIGGIVAFFGFGAIAVLVEVAQTFERRKGVLSFTRIECLPDTVDPRGPKGK